MTVIIGYLPSPEGQAALKAGFAEAKARGVRALVVNSPRLGAASEVTTLDASEAAALEEQARKAGVEAEVLQPEHEDNLVETLNRCAKENDASMIVIGLRKRSAIGKFILGSQAQRILLDSDVPVLTTTP
ncbi:Universal stress protein [Brevibacterium ravenspurgense]|uniref:Universal stress protein n=1 Tax=Brevibacterium ravenspurgense TaxID=479117 RepID=A0A150H554_9MICO|nr:universal stress protein [Brevibacterium ravenspurgense]KXZ57183.1 Universal stress protein [Brevibacterium ravenspurgense]